ncbi:MAG: HAD family hydrolase [Planctomycetota bacterium]|nr:MAG: HAD family hydrolase [Planctomycetota bacterium]
MGKKRFVVLDLDGTIIVECNYLSDPDQVELIPEAVNALLQFNNLGLGMIVVTNQSAIGRGIIDDKQLKLIHERFQELLHKGGVSLDGIYYCPHLPEARCNCRKPQPGLLELAGRELDFTPRECFVIGDKACDIGLGRKVGATTFLVKTGYGAQVAANEEMNPDYIVDELPEAEQIIAHLLNKETIK